MVEERPEPLQPLDLGIHARPVDTQDVQERSTALLEQVADLGERDTDVAQRTDPAKAPQVLLAVNALATLRPRRRHEQPDVFVVVERAHGQAGRARQLSDAPPALARGSFFHRI